MHNMYRDKPEQTQINLCQQALMEGIKMLPEGEERTRSEHAVMNLMRLIKEARSRPHPAKRCRHCGHSP